jgi:hypothetical protein
MGGDFFKNLKAWPCRTIKNTEIALLLNKIVHRLVAISKKMGEMVLKQINLSLDRLCVLKTLMIQR